MSGEYSGQALVLHEDPVSGNCYKIRLTAALLDLPIERRLYDITKGETRTPEFLETVDAGGRIPVLQIGEHFLPESNAACWFLAEGTALVPDDRFERATMLRWMFFEQYSHEPNVATLRFWRSILGENNLSPAQRGQIAGKESAGEAALNLLDRHLAQRDWMAADAATLADIVLFAYTHVADEGGFDLPRYGNLVRWIERVRRLPGFIAMSD